MAHDTVTISRQEYETLKKKHKIDQDHLQDITRGIRDILEGSVHEVKPRDHRSTTSR